MDQADYQQVIDELDAVIIQTCDLVARFEATGMDEAMQDDYLTLHELYSRSVRQQRDYTQAMLDAPAPHEAPRQLCQK